MADETERLAGESAEEREDRLLEAELWADPNVDYDDGSGDGPADHHLFFDDYHEHHHAGKVTRKRAITRR
jgi:hypothetical protein